MYKIFLSTLCLILPLISLVSLPEVLACTADGSAEQTLVGCASTSGNPGVPIQTGENNFKQFIVRTAQGAITLGGLLAVGAIVWAGIQYTKAYGEDENMKKAKTTVIYALIGLLLLMASFPLVDIFISFLYRLGGQ